MQIILILKSCLKKTEALIISGKASDLDHPSPEQIDHPWPEKADLYMSN